MTRSLALIVAVAGISRWTHPAQAQPAGEAAPEAFADHARSLPPLPVHDGAVALPLTTDGPFQWHPVREGVSLESTAGKADAERTLKVSYTRTRGKVAGAALVVPTGTFTNLQSLEFTVRSKRGQALMACLKDTSGAVWSLGSFSANEKSEPITLNASKVGLDRFQNGPAQKDAKFDPATCTMLMLIDISGFMNVSEPACEWTVQGLRAVVPGRTSPAKAPDPGKKPVAPSTPNFRAEPTQPDPAKSIKAEAVFFDALNLHPETRAAALDSLRAAQRAAPRDGRTTLLLGLCHLWTSLESPDPAASDELILAEHFLARARALLPDDHRIPSWLDPVAIAIARAEGDQDKADLAREDLRGAFRADPCFHSVGLGIASFDAPRDSAEFRQGLEAMRAGFACGNSPAAQNRPRWPHNVEGFLFALAQYETKAGEAAGAKRALAALFARDDYAAWPHRALAERFDASLDDSVAKYADGDSRNDPPFVLSRASGVSCTACHQGGK